jgi:phosphoribosylformylglycinamidine cyclo-ligase
MPRPVDPRVAKVLEYVDDEEAIRTFNLGFGWLAVVSPEDAEKALNVGTGAVRLGEIGGTALQVSLDGG